MVYKDKDKQREANKKAQAKFKAKVKGITEQGITSTTEVIPKALPDCVPVMVKNRYNRYPCEPEYMDTINHLLEHSLDELQERGTWIPVWRYWAGQEAV